MRSKLALFLVAFFAVVATPKTDLEAGGWGRTNETFQYENTTWQGVHYDMNNLAFTAFIPNYKSTSMSKGFVALHGEIGKDIVYGISTTMGAGFNPPKTLAEFQSLIQDANPDYVVEANEHTLENVLYVVDLEPISKDETYRVRMISTADRILHMGTTDLNEARRLKFYESISIK